MSQAQESNRILTIPNLISFIRLAAIPFFWWLVLGAEEVGAATILYTVVALTDWVDGYLARRLGQVTKLGKALDPVADRLMIASAIVVGLIAGIVPGVIGITLIAREVYMAIVVLTMMSKGAGTLEVSWLGKGATLLVYTSIGWFYFAAIPFLEVVLLPAAWVAGVVGLVLYWITAFQYTVNAIRVMKELESASATSEESR